MMFILIKYSVSCSYALHVYVGGPKNNRIYFFKWFIRFYTIRTLISFKVLFF